MTNSISPGGQFSVGGTTGAIGSLSNSVLWVGPDKPSGDNFILWINTEDARLYGYWNDGETSQWVDLSIPLGSSIQGTALQPSQLLASILSVDGVDSTLDADLLDGNHGFFYTNADNMSSGTLDPDRLPSSSTSAKGAVEKSTSAENVSGVAVDVFPDVVGVKEIVKEFTDISETILESGTAAIYAVGSGVKKILVYAQAPGSGGGGISVSGDNAVGGGGASGDFIWKLIDVEEGDTFTYTVGSGGAGGASGKNDGSTGTNTTFSDGDTVNMVAAAPLSGGAGGGNVVNKAIQKGGLAPTGSSGYDGIIPGVDGDWGIIANSSPANIGRGAKSFLGNGSEILGVNLRGGAGSGYGSGGGGAIADNSSTNRAGGDGADGVLIIKEIK